jgi:hypothetical protein
MRNRRKCKGDPVCKFKLIVPTTFLLFSLLWGPHRPSGSIWVTYLIDKSGVVQYVRKGVPLNKDFLNKLKRLQ